MSSHGRDRSKPGGGPTGPDVEQKTLGGAIGKTTLVEQTCGRPVLRSVPATPMEAAGHEGAAPRTANAGPVAAPSAVEARGPSMLEIFGRRHDADVQTHPAASAGAAAPREATVHAAAEAGIATPASPLPHALTMKELFGRHDVSDVQAHTGPEAAASARAMGAEAYATGNHVVLGDKTDLHTVAHEAAHVVQQRGGVQLKGGVGAAGDSYEQHADAVADKVVRGESAEALLDQHAAPGGAQGVQRAVQRKDSPEDTQILDHQADLKNTDVEIPALEGALLSTRLDAVKKGLLSQSAFDASLDLSRAMAQLQPAAKAKGGGRRRRAGDRHQRGAAAVSGLAA
jgi:hypothetical protein